MLMSVLGEEVDAYLGRGKYKRGDGFRGYRNGRSPPRLTLGSGTVALRTPRVRDIPSEQEPFESKTIRKYQRRSDTSDETFMNLFVEGLATRDFERSLRLPVGEQAPLSPSVISRLTRRFKAQYDAFDRRDLSEHAFVYIWADGIYRKADWGRRSDHATSGNHTCAAGPHSRVLELRCGHDVDFSRTRHGGSVGRSSDCRSGEVTFPPEPVPAADQ